MGVLISETSKNSEKRWRKGLRNSAPSNPDLVLWRTETTKDKVKDKP